MRRGPGSAPHRPTSFRAAPHAGHVAKLMPVGVGGGSRATPERGRDSRMEVPLAEVWTESFATREASAATWTG
jgi:hypothetical protein